jgi:hypothetical protein
METSASNVSAFTLLAPPPAYNLPLESAFLSAEIGSLAALSAATNVSAALSSHAARSSFLLHPAACAAGESPLKLPFNSSNVPRTLAVDATKALASRFSFPANACDSSATSSSVAIKVLIEGLDSMLISRMII